MKNKSKFFGIIAIIAVIGLAMTSCDNATTSTTTGLDFSFNSALAGYMVTGRGTVTGSVIVIPDTHNGRPVRGIGPDAFRGEMDGTGNRVTSVSIPSSVTTIGARAFIFNNLTSVTIPDGVIYIRHHAFASNQLTSATIGNNVTYIGADAFTRNQLTSITIGNSVTHIMIHAFTENQLTNVTIPSSITLIDSFAFYRNPLTRITIPFASLAEADNAWGSWDGINRWRSGIPITAFVFAPTTADSGSIQPGSILMAANQRTEQPQQ
ncbi:MAG: leucine-rich repeat domain-containing protein [Treponema sp.]|nr:leucine-rich repeat domain-containing protein [Treponema sp.]